MIEALATRAKDSTSIRWAFPEVFPEVHQVVPPTLLVQGPALAWLRTVAERIEYLASLPTVDPFGSAPMNAFDVRDALLFLARVMGDDSPPPFIGRLSSGGVQLNWRRDGAEIEAIFDNARAEKAVSIAFGLEDEDLPADDAGLVAAVAARLAMPSRELAAAD